MVAAPAGAEAAVTVGETFSPTPTGLACPSTLQAVQTVEPSAQHMVPSAGVLTSWSHQTSTMPNTTVRLKVARATGNPNEFLIVGESAAENATANMVHTYTNIRIPVQTGDLLGVRVTGDGDCGQLAGGYTVNYLGGMNTPPGSTVTLNNTAGVRLSVSATLEPDADGDGFGDETQDQCPTDGSTQGTCPPPPDTPDTAAPDTTIASGPEGKTKSKSASFAFGGTDTRAVASFECKLDDGSFQSCTSPKSYSGLKKGSHTFSVRAIDAAGNTDQSPATRTWTVKRKRKKKKK